ncbi:hypothetical protein GXP67_05820 [Rhodocytophaga rosea]|uniref:Uncharacterized protein n=1 Tax=Rhodocytophaga rosea TaxID=2704465 RepID=A0A6C0GE82_9BACT|nr:hypothetical protein [Rhodocytophaga rosea]QHT66217.1 hypothetical protein GXP67_05820 [Rhodocytophaga rosea]
MTYPHQTTKVVQFSRPRILGLLGVSFRFYRIHFLPLLALMAVAALGRAFQMGAAGKISSTAYVLLEISTELSRVLMLIFILGQGSLKVGLRRCLRVFTIKKNQRKQVWQRMSQRFRACWPALLWNLIGFSILAFVTNYSINWLAHSQQVLLELKALHLLSPIATPTPVVFFLKNLTVIPFTLIFECSVLLWLIGKIEK